MFGNCCQPLLESAIFEFWSDRQQTELGVAIGDANIDRGDHAALRLVEDQKIAVVEERFHLGFRGSVSDQRGNICGIACSGSANRSTRNGITIGRKLLHDTNLTPATDAGAFSATASSGVTSGRGLL
jgi:hypothetical protein